MKAIKRRRGGRSEGVKPPRQSRGRPEKGREKLAPPNPKRVDRGPAGANLSSLLKRVTPPPIRRGETLPYRKGEMLPPHRIPPPPPLTKEATEEWSLVVGRKAGKRLAKRDDAAQDTTPSATKSKAGGRTTVLPPTTVGIGSPHSLQEEGKEGAKESPQNGRGSHNMPTRPIPGQSQAGHGSDRSSQLGNRRDDGATSRHRGPDF